jgi:hypothetical protein
MSVEDQNMLPDETIINKIYLIRGQKVMLDRDLANLYEVETRRLKEQVRRNHARFPDNFMFELTKEELFAWRKQFGQGQPENMGMRIPPFAFTEYGILMLANVLKSERAIKMSIRIIEVFVKARELLMMHKDTLTKLESIESRLDSHDEQIMVIFDYLKHLEEDKQRAFEQNQRKRIGY